METTAYAAVRETHDGDYLDLLTISADRTETYRKARKADAEVPGWARNNLMAGIVRVTVTMQEWVI